MSNIFNLLAESGADYISDDTGNANPGVSFKASATEGVGARFDHSGVLSSPTVAVVQLSPTSTASAPVFELLNQGFVSATTILFTTGATAGVGAIRVKHGDNYKWLPLLPDGSVTAAARG